MPTRPPLALVAAALALAVAVVPLHVAAAQAPTRPAVPPSAADSAAVVRAAFDYLDGFYDGDTTHFVRALRPDVSKYGFWRDSTGRWEGERMTYPEAIAYAKRVEARHRPVNPKWPREVKVFEIQDRTASAKVTAWWGTDYLLLGNFDGRWMITDILWQGPLAK